MANDKLIIKGARQHNLKNVDIELPRNQLVVFTGPSGSGKSSLAFDTIYAEGQRRYTESMSAYARQFLERTEKPDVDFITGLSPAIAIQQQTQTRTPRSTVATATEIYDYLRLLFARIGKTFSPISGQEVKKDTPNAVAKFIVENCDGRFYLGFPLPDFGKKTSTKQLIELLKSRGFFRVLIADVLVDLNQETPKSLENALVIVDRLAVKKDDEAFLTRFADSLETAFKEGNGVCMVKMLGEEIFTFSEVFELDGIRFQEPNPQLFSFNSPIGACPTCQGFGKASGIDANLVIPNPNLSIRQGALAPFNTEAWRDWHKSLIASCARTKLPIDTPYYRLLQEDKDKLWNGFDEFKGINAFFEHLASEKYKMHYRILAARYRGYTVCPDCDGHRLRKEALYVQINGKNIGEISAMTIEEAEAFFANFQPTEFELQVADQILAEIKKRLLFLHKVGLEYLQLNRLSQTLSGGESQRIHLATSLGSALVGAMYVLDEPSIGLHPRDTHRLISSLEHLRDLGNSVLVVEHDKDMMEHADVIVDLGEGSGTLGGNITFKGTYPEILVAKDSLTGKYLSDRLGIEVPKKRRPFNPDFKLVLQGASQNNLKHLDVTFPLGMLVAVTGVSGSGKSTLVHDTLFAGLKRLKEGYTEEVGKHKSILGHVLVDNVEMIDQTPIGKSPRSNPATYTKVWDDIRDLMALSPLAQVRGYQSGFFSFNVAGGRCETCQGDGVTKIEMQFLADLYLTCEGCNGKRFKQEVFDVQINGKNVHDFLNMTVDDAVAFFADYPKICRKIKVLQDVGLGYITLGQPSNTLSGGEAQRVKLASFLAKPSKDHTLYVFDEPTTGLHFDDIRKLLKAFNALIEKGHSIILIEHNLDVIKSADWVIDIGPEGGDKGGYLVAEGTPEEVANVAESITGKYLKEVLR